MHVAEVRTFLSEVPDAPQQMVPDPWREMAGRRVLGDVDLDGRSDTLSAGAMGRWVSLFDLDQDSFGDGAPPPVDQVVLEKGFDAEVAFFQSADKVYAWYDLDNDGAFDRLLVGSAMSAGKAAAAYALADGVLTKDEAAKGAALVDLAAFADPGMKGRFQRIGELTFPRWVKPSTQDAAVPDPPWGGGRSGVGLDLDRDGKLDSIWALSPFSTGLLVDADENVLGGLKPTDVARALESRAVGADFSLVSQGRRVWSFHDLDRDERFDLVLYTPDSSTGVAAEAWKLDGDKPVGPAPEHVGLKLVRPGVLGSAESAARLRNAVTRYFPPHLVASDDAPADAIPSPVADVGSDIDFEQVDVPGWQQAVVSVLGNGASSLLFDLDRDSFKANRNPRDVARVVATGRFRAEFAWLQRGKLEWTFYDTDKDGRFDLVLFTTDSKKNQAEQAWRIDKKGNVEVAPNAVSGKMFRAGLFRKDLAKGFRTVVPLFFQPEELE